ncbi:MAG TPA: zf-HC2 domain-containing protein [Casimicrobiaceae bacterium]|jgi:hypothetical protein
MLFRLTHVLTCKEASRLLSQSLDRPLGRFEGWKLRMHLRLCEVCTRFGEQLRFMREAMHRYRS